MIYLYIKFQFKVSTYDGNGERKLSIIYIFFFQIDSSKNQLNEPIVQYKLDQYIFKMYQFKMSMLDLDHGQKLNSK